MQNQKCATQQIVARTLVYRMQSERRQRESLLAANLLGSCTVGMYFSVLHAMSLMVCKLEENETHFY